MSTGPVSPLLTQLGMGGVGGYLTGYAFKKIGKVLAIFSGLAFLCLQYLAYHGIIEVDYDKLVLLIEQLTGKASGLATSVLSNLPFGASFVAGFALGFRKG